MWALASTVVTALIPFVIKLITYFIDKKINDNELRKQFLDLLVTMQSHEDTPVKIREKCQSQIERIRAQLAKENQV